MGVEPVADHLSATLYPSPRFIAKLLARLDAHADRFPDECGTFVFKAKTSGRQLLVMDKDIPLRSRIRIPKVGAVACDRTLIPQGMRADYVTVWWTHRQFIGGEWMPERWDATIVLVNVPLRPPIPDDGVPFDPEATWRRP